MARRTGEGAGADAGEVEFDRLVPRWMFALRTVRSRVLAAVLFPVAFSIPLLLIDDVADLRLGPLLVLAVVAVAAVAGWWATLLAGTIVTLAYWWFGVPVERSFRLDPPSQAIAVGAMAALTVGIALMARRVQQSVDDVRALDARQRALRDRSERVAAQAAAVVELAAELAGARTMAEVAQAAVDRIALPAWPTAASIAIVRDNHLHMLAARGTTPEVVARLEQTELDPRSWLGEALAGHLSIVDDRDEFAAAHPEAGVLRLYPSGSWAVVPFRSENTVGLLSLWFVGPQRLTELAGQLSLMGEILSTALERAHAEELERIHLVRLEQAFAERDRIARTLSTTLLPPRLPALPGFTAAGWLQPAHASEVAGDFYDLFPIPGDDWVAVVGDVCGKGAEAAAVTSLARYAARVTALEDADPTHIADVANAALVADPSDLFCTMAIARYHREVEEVEITLAGHLQVRLVSDGCVQRIGRFGSALGYATTPPMSERHPLRPGDAIVMVSDGLIERDPSFGEPELDRAIAEAWAASDSAIDLATLLRERIESVPATRHDDLTALVVRRLP